MGNNELLFNLHLTTYKRWDEMMKPWKRFKIGKALKKCKAKCMKADISGGSKWFGYKYHYDTSYETWKEGGFDVNQKPVFPCDNCLTHFSVIKPGWKRIVRH